MLFVGGPRGGELVDLADSFGRCVKIAIPRPPPKYYKEPIPDYFKSSTVTYSIYDLTCSSSIRLATAMNPVEACYHIQGTIGAFERLKRHTFKGLQSGEDIKQFFIKLRNATPRADHSLTEKDLVRYSKISRCMTKIFSALEIDYENFHNAIAEL